MSILRMIKTGVLASDGHISN